MYGATACTKKLAHSKIREKSFDVGKKESETRSKHGESAELANLHPVA